MTITSQINLFQSGFQALEKVPYITLAKLDNTLLNRDTCSNRIEQATFQVTIFDNNYQNLDKIVFDIENICDWGKLTCSTRRFMGMTFAGKSINETEPGLYQAQLLYEIIAQKDFSSSLFSRTISGNIFQRLLNKFDRVSTTNYGHSNWERPFLFIPGYETVDAFLTTLSRVEATKFEIAVEGYNPVDIETITEDIDNLISYCRIDVGNGRRFTNLEWLGDSLVELEPELWRGSVMYEMMLEKNI